MAVDLLGNVVFTCADMPSVRVANLTSQAMPPVASFDAGGWASRYPVYMTFTPASLSFDELGFLYAEIHPQTARIFAL